MKDDEILTKPREEKRIKLPVKATTFQGPVRTLDMARAQRKVKRAMPRGKR